MELSHHGNSNVEEVLFFGGKGKTRRIRPSGDIFHLKPHVDELRAALGLSLKFVPNKLLESIEQLEDAQNRVECLMPNRQDLLINRKQCMWCRSRNVCNRSEHEGHDGKMALRRWDEDEVPDDDWRLIESFLRKFVFPGVDGMGARDDDRPTKNQAFFFFDEKSPFVFSESNEYLKGFICLPLFSGKTIQPISDPKNMSEGDFSPSLAYCPPLKRNLTIFELQILESLVVTKSGEEEGSGTVKLTCYDYYSRVREIVGIGQFGITDGFFETKDGERLGAIIDRAGYVLDPEIGELAKIPLTDHLGARRGPNVDFFEQWGEEENNDVIGSLKIRTLQFLNRLFEKITDDGGEFSGKFREVSFVEPRASGMLLFSEGQKPLSSGHSGVKIIKESVCNGLTRPYLIVDGNFNSEEPDYYFEVEAGRSPEKMTTRDESQNRPTNEDVMAILNPVLDQYKRRREIFSSNSVYEAAITKKRGYVIFDYFEFRTACSFHDRMRYNLLTTRHKELGPLFDFMEEIAERAMAYGNEEEEEFGRRFLQEVDLPSFSRETDVVEIIRKIEKMRLSESNFSMVKTSLGDVDESDKNVEIDSVIFDYIERKPSAKMADRGEEGRVVTKIELRRKRTRKDTKRGMLLRGSIKERFIMTGEGRRKLGRSVWAPLQDCLTGKTLGSGWKSPIYGGLYLSEGVRTLLNGSPDLVRTIVSKLRERAYFGTLFFSLESESEGFGLMWRMDDFKINNGGKETPVILWSGFRSPIEGKNLLFTEFH